MLIVTLLIALLSAMLHPIMLIVTLLIALLSDI